MITQKRRDEILKGLKEGTIINENVYFEYDEFGKWNRDYLDMSVPAEELALPRNEIEEALLSERIRLETGPILRGRLSCKSPIPLQEMFESYDPDYDDPNSKVVLESFKKTNALTLYSIFTYKWQNRDWTAKTEEEKIRPVVVWESDITDDLLVIEITSQSKKYRKYQVLIKEWESIGLKKKSWVRVDNFDILLDEYLREFIGNLTWKTIIIMYKKIAQFNKLFGEDPWDFMYWIKSNRIELYPFESVVDKGLIMDYKKVKPLSMITSFNLTYLFFECAKKNKYNPKMYWITLYTTKDEKLSIFFCIFEARRYKYGTIYTDPKYAGIIPEQKLKECPSMERGIVDHIVKRLRKYHNIQTIYHNIYKLTEEDIRLIKPGVSEYEILTTIKENRGDE